MARRPDAQVIQAPAGVGKTTAYAKMLADRKTGRDEVYVPTLALAEELQARIRGLNTSRPVWVVRGREQCLPDGTPLCQQAPVAARLARQGIPVSGALCYPRTGAGCPHYGSCTYIGQFRPGDAVRIYTHAYLGLERNRYEGLAPDLAVIDESFFKACIEVLDLNVASVASSTVLPARVKHLISDLSLVVQRGGSVRDVLRQFRRAYSGGLSASVKLLRDQAATRMASAVLDRVAAREASLVLKVVKVIEHVLRAVRHQEQPQSIEFDAQAGNLRCHVLKPLGRLVGAVGRGCETLVVDANASKPVLEQFFNIKAFTSSSAPRNARVIQCVSRRGSTSSLVPAKNSDPKSKAAASAALVDINHLIAVMSRGGQRVLVVGPSAVVGHAKAGIPALIHVPVHCESIHFGALRGKDVWKDFDAVLIIGRNQPPVRAIEDQARALFMADLTPLQSLGREDLLMEVRGYTMADGSEVGVDVPVHPDARVQSLLEQVREHESTQAIDRLRLVHSSREKLVVVLSNVPLDIPVDALLTWGELVHGTRVEQALDASDVVLPLEPKWLATNFSGLWKTAGAAKKDVQQATKKGEFANSISIRKMSLYGATYRLPNQKRASSLLAKRPSKTAIEKALKKLVGPGAVLIGPITPWEKPKRRILPR